LEVALPVPTALLEGPAPVALHPAVRVIVVAMALALPVAASPDVAMAAPVPVPRYPDVSDARRGHDFISRGGRSDVDVDRGGGRHGDGRGRCEKGSNEGLLHGNSLLS